MEDNLTALITPVLQYAWIEPEVTVFLFFFFSEESPSKSNKLETKAFTCDVSYVRWKYDIFNLISA